MIKILESRGCDQLCNAINVYVSFKILFWNCHSETANVYNIYTVMMQEKNRKKFYVHLNVLSVT